MKHGEAPRIAVSWGELIDRMTILEIRSEKLSRPEALENVQRELAHLQAAGEPALCAHDGIRELKARLKAVNQALWAVEDRLREKEAAGAFDAEFIDLARSVYKANDERTALKKILNEKLGSPMTEEKLYASYVRGPESSS